MINIQGANDATDIAKIKTTLNPRSIQMNILTSMERSAATLTFESVDALLFELQLREAIVQSSIDLHNSKLGFAVFRESKCNTNYWSRTRNGGLLTLPSVKPSDAILDIYNSGYRYATECATAMVIVYYKALLTVYGTEKFNRLFPSIYLMNWHNLDPKIASSSTLVDTDYYLLGDRRYFANPDVSPETPEWQGENTIQLPNDLYYGHGLGIATPKQILTLLNQARKDGATKSAYLRDTVGRLDFKALYRLK